MGHRLRAEGGQASAEYLGVIVVVAVIVAGLVTASPGVSNALGSGLRRAVCLIVGHDSCPDAAPKPKRHSGGPLGFVKARAGDVADAAKATGGFVGDVGVGAYDSVKGTLTLGWELSPTRAAIDFDGFSRDARKFGRATWYGVTHPAELGKALIDWNDLTGGHPGKAVGQWLPDIALALATGGLGTAADGSVEVARDLSRVEKAAEAARDLSRVEKAAEAARATEVATGTVWDSIVATQPVYEGTSLPRSLVLKVGAVENVWVAPNASKHILQRIDNVSRALQTVQTQNMLSSLRSAVVAANEQGISFGKLIRIGGWDLIFEAPRRGEPYPALYHALYRG